ncbi:MAG: 3-phosphoshikimate 1-carboxyvinyltransferase, partial [Candidatus Dormibacteraeota bacterium]|nr:3-phosphoshikimate 1-carboxyvinyltransferase [Candidatus Dormibacteraeota bacterium]
MTARIPGSKSLTNRALLCAAGAPGRSLLHRPLASDDTLAFAGGLRALGYRVDVEGAGTEVWAVTGTGRGPEVRSAEVFCRDAGTAARFLPALAATGEGRFRFDGTEQLRRRPLGPLLAGLEALGAAVTREGARDLPFVLQARGLRGGEVVVDAHQSSQYVSGLLLAAPLMERPLRLRTTDLASRPYVEMTLGVMRRFGVAAEGSPENGITMPVGGYRPRELTIEPDASTASYFFAAAALTGRTLTVPALGTSSAQGDLHFVDVLEAMGATVRREEEATTVIGPPGGLDGDVTVDMNAISDTMMTLAAVAPYADGPVTITGVGHTRRKESDRVAVTAANLRACGVRVEEGEDWLRIHPAQPRPATVACHRDHRIAMSFSVLGLRAP